MSWLAWRLQRLTIAVVVSAGAFVTLVAVLAHLGGARRGAPQAVPELYLVPVLLSMFVGAPLFAREFERGTPRLVWTQGRTRSHWFVAHCTLALGVVLVVGAISQAAVSLTLAPGDMSLDAFSLTGVLPVTVAVFAVALGLLCGALLRRTVMAIVVALVLTLGVQAVVTFVARPHYLPPETTIVTFTPDTAPLHGPPGSWVVHETPVGEPTDCVTRYLCTRQFAIEYQPASRYWTFQAIESGIYILLAAAAMAVAWAAVARRQ